MDKILKNLLGEPTYKIQIENNLMLISKFKTIIVLIVFCILTSSFSAVISSIIGTAVISILIAPAFIMFIYFQINETLDGKILKFVSAQQEITTDEEIESEINKDVQTENNK